MRAKKPAKRCPKAKGRERMILLNTVEGMKVFLYPPGSHEETMWH